VTIAVEIARYTSTDANVESLAALKFRLTPVVGYDRVRSEQ